MGGIVIADKEGETLSRNISKIKRALRKSKVNPLLEGLEPSANRESFELRALNILIL